MVPLAYQMTKDLETGNALIDQEHRELFAAINNLLDACSRGRGRNELEKTAQFLQSYTSKHFADEERLQMQSRYPAYPTHKSYHDAFKKTTEDLMRRLAQNGPTVALVGELNTALGGWLVNHIKQEDKKLAEYLRGQK